MPAGRTFRPGKMGYLTLLYSCIVEVHVRFTSILSAISIIWDRLFGFLKEVLIASVSLWAVAAGEILSSATVAMFRSAMLIALAPFVEVS
jgi:ABC-2 type transport system permease protein